MDSIVTRKQLAGKTTMQDCRHRASGIQRIEEEEAMGGEKMKDDLLRSVEANGEEIIHIGQEIYRTPETGFKEFKTQAFVQACYKKWGITYTSLEEYPAIKVTLDTGRPGPGLAIVGELDAIICREHPDADPKTGAVHACGHNAQIAAMMGALKAFSETGAWRQLWGKLHFIAVPAEEYIEVAYRMDLRRQGVIRYLGGKPELLWRGFFDDVDLCISIHSTTDQEKKIKLGSSLNGCLVKSMRFTGRAAHAGSAPEQGINALYAASLALSAINAIRETFRDEECIRVHPIITKGGDIVNVIPSDVRMETFVRGRRLEDMMKASIRVDRALVGAAYALGAKVEIEDLPGYMPASYDAGLADLGLLVGGRLVGEDQVTVDAHDTGSTDWGDLSKLMPVLETYVGGMEGTAHGADYGLKDPETAFVLPAKYLALMAAELMEEEAAAARQILEAYQPTFTSKEAYFRHMDQLFRTRVLPEENYEDATMEQLIRELENLGQKLD